MTSDKIAINYVYLSPNSPPSSSGLVGSLNGGTTLYIHGQGFDLSAANNLVYVGMNYCDLTKGGVSASGDTITCDTTAPIPGTSLVNLPITIAIPGKPSYTCTTSGCKFNYYSSVTPLLYAVYPRSAVANQFIKFYGIHRITDLGGSTASGLDMGSIKGLYIGDTLCNRFDIIEQSITLNDANYITCRLAPVQVGGYYNVLQWMTPGKATNTQRINYGSVLNNLNYQFITIPSINQVSTNIGGSQGVTLTITGTGFTSNSSIITVTAGNNPCNIISSTASSIKCVVQPDNTAAKYGQLPYTGITPGNQKNAYVSGTGFSYQRFNIANLASKSISGFITAVQAKDPSIVLQQQSIKTQLQSPDIYAAPYGQVYKGYFRAPADGNYIFRGLADDLLSVFLSDIVNSTQTIGINYSNPLISTTVYSQRNRNYYYDNNPSLTSSPVAMKFGDLYYMEVYHLNPYYGGFMMVSVQVPNTNTKLANQRFAVHMFNTTATVDPEIISWQLNGATGGTFDFFYYKNPKDLTTKVTATGNYNMGATDFANFLKKFSFFSNYKFTVAKTTTGTSTNWTVTITSYRDPADVTLSSALQRDLSKLTGSSISLSPYTTIQDHSPPISGTFTLNINAKDIAFWDSTANAYNYNIPFNTSSWDLAYYIQTTLGYPFVEVDIIMSGDNFVDGVTWIVSYVGINSDVGTPVITSNLAGGKSGTTPTFTSTVLRSYSSNLLVQPITSQFLYTYASTPQIIVNVGKVTSECNTLCTYTVDSTRTPTLNSATLNGNTLTLSVVDPTGKNSLQNSLVTLDNQICTELTGTYNSFTCKLPKNSDNSPLLRAGSYLPVVQLLNIGIASTSGVTNLDIPLTLTNASPQNSLKKGGLTITLTGTGFPTSMSETISIKMCSFDVKILSVTNTVIKILSSTCVDTLTQIIITYNGLSKSIDYTYIETAVHTVDSITPNSASPVLKGKVNIQGTGFGTDVSAIQVYLAADTDVTKRIYQLNVLSLTGNTIVAYLGGGLPGKYKLIVSKAGQGDSIPGAPTKSDFTYELVVDNVSPATGSIGGGTIISITGKNFSPDTLDNQVYVGDTKNWLCSIISVTTTQIVCQTPAYDFPDPDTPTQKVTVVGKVIIQSTCGAACTFTYLTVGNSPSITAPGITTYKAGDSVTINGNNLIKNGINPKVKVGKVQANVISSTNNQVTFTMPALSNGTYQVTIYVDGIGYAYPKIYLDTLFGLSSTPLTPLSGSTVGNIITLNGNGFILNTNVNFNFSVTSTIGTPNYKILSSTPTAIKIQIIGGSDGASYTLSNTFGSNTISAVFQCSASFTLAFKLKSLASVGYSSLSQFITFQRTSASPNGTLEAVYALPINSNNVIVGNPISLTFTSTSTIITADGIPLTAGKYSFRIYYNPDGYAAVTGYVQITQSAYIYSSTKSSYFGGQIFTVGGVGLNPNSVLNIGGLNANLISSTTSLLTYRIPPYISPLSQSLFNLASQTKLIGTPFGDLSSSVPNVFDNLLSTVYSSSNSAGCFIGMDFGSSFKASISRIRYYPNQLWTSAGKYLIGAQFLGSNDNTTWDLLYTIDNTVHTGYNIWRPSPSLLTNYRYIKFQHNSTSKCQLANLEFYGILYQADPVGATLESYKVAATFTDGFHTATWPQIVEYRTDATPIVTSISPKNGNPVGNYNITITGTGFDIDPTKTSINIDGISCPVQGTPTTTQIICQVGKRTNLPKANTFDIFIGQNRPVMNCPNFTYVSRWSDINTWGGDLPPTDGDSVYVPPGMVLYVDQSTPNLQAIVVQGSIIFADQDDYSVQTQSLIVNFGVFQAGTQANPYQHQLTFTLHGSYYDKQLPGFGNKVIGCHCCKFDMYGTPRSPTWTQLAVDKTINRGDTQITVRQPVDWKIGQTIAVASTSFQHNQGEQRTIVDIDATKTIITVDYPFNYLHLSKIQSFGTGNDKARMIAQVGLLSRNIKVTGDRYSAATQYGAHVMMHGPATGGLVGHIAYTQVTQCGQPQIIGRYCLHFHMNGDVSQSYVRGNSVHQSYARILTLHGIHYLTVEWNVGYRVQGHNFFLQDGIETYNVIQDNLAISSIQVWTMLQSDISVASYWITNPLNTLRRNHAAGSDFYGIWYQIKPNPDGLSATTDICPPGLPIGQSSNNVAHSNTRFGLRIFKLFSSTYPCVKPRNDLQVDPWSLNPSIQNTFSHYTLYMNNVSGLLGQQVGNTIFNNFTIVDSGYSGVQFQITNFSKQFVTLQNAVIVGQSVTNGPSTAALAGVRGIITPRTDGFMANDIRFYKFPTGTIVFQACSNCDNTDCRTTTGKSSYFSKIAYSQISGKYIHWKYVRRQIYYDLDGTLTKPFDNIVRANATLIPYFAHNDIPNICVTSATSVDLWDTSLVCGDSVVVRSIAFGNAIPTSWFNNGDMKIYRLSSSDQNISTITTGYSDVWVLKAMVDKPQAWAAPFVMNYMYDLWWLSGIDFTHMAVIPSQYFNQVDPGVILRVNYTAHRQLFDIGNMVSGKLIKPLIAEGTAVPNAATCNIGQYYHDDNTRYLYLCVSGKNKTIANYIDVNSITCRYACPKPGNVFEKQSTVRLWSNATQWPNGVLPKQGDNVTINGNWTIIMDIDPAPINNLTIDGSVIIADRNTVIVAHFIYIRAGSLTAGNSSVPFQYNLTIKLLGNHDDFTYFIDPIVNANKYMVVTGEINLYGIVPGSVWTRLSASAKKGDTSITVDDATDWAVGNTIGIAPSFKDSTQTQKVIITAINGNTITFTPALIYPHYGGAQPTVVNQYGVLDMRAGVSLFDRNIKIISGNDSGWGFRVLIYAFVDDNKTQWRGNAIIQGVQFNQGGQQDTDYAALYFQNLLIGTGQSHVYGSSFHDCGGYCLTLVNSYNVTIQNNAFFLGYKYIVSVESMYNYAFINNFMAGARLRVSMINAAQGDDTSCYNQYKQINFATDNNTVKSNLCQGSAMQGFVFPHTPCNYLGKYGLAGSTSFIKNTAGSAVVAFALNIIRGDNGYDCLGGQSMFGYGSNIGIIVNPFGPTTLIFDGLMMADNVRSVSMKIGNHASNNTAYLRNSWISALARPTCTQCYGDGANQTQCKNNHGVRMFMVSGNGQEFPKKFGPPLDTICKPEAFDAKAFLYNVTFDSFRQSYPTLAQCKNNVIFKPHPSATDFTAGHYLTKTFCTNCDADSYGYFPPPNPSHLGWLGGCGLILCTGNNNYLIYDTDGSFLGYSGTILANNSIIGGNTTGCTQNKIMNGHICARQDFAVLQYQSIAPDFNRRIMWPVNMTFDGGNWTSVTNGFIEWSWSNKQPMNQRLARFITVFQLYQVYNMTFASQPPADMRFTIQKRQVPGDNNQWVILKIYYPIPNVIRVSVGGKVIQSILSTSEEPITNRKAICGANKYFYQNSTIHFVVTSSDVCIVRLTVTSNVQITARLQMSMSSFFNADGVTKFIDRICAFLNINDKSRLKVVGVSSGSTIIRAFVTTVNPDLNADGTAKQANATQTRAQLQALADQLNNGANSGALTFPDLAQILSLSVTVNVVNTDGSLATIPLNSSRSTTKITIIIAVVVSVLSAVLIGVTSYLVIRKLRSRQKIGPQDLSQRSEMGEIELSKHAQNPMLQQEKENYGKN